MNKGTLYTSYFAKLKQGMGMKISVARFNPKWLKKEHIDDWFVDLAPSIELLNDYKNGSCDWEEYTKRYNEELGIGYVVDTRVNKMINCIRSTLNNGEDVTIYCYEKSSDDCHRHLLGKFLKSKGFEVKEIE